MVANGYGITLLPEVAIDVEARDDSLAEDQHFKLDFNTAFPTGPARPHGIAMK